MYNTHVFYDQCILSPIRRGFAPGIVNVKKGCTLTRLAAASTPASSSNKTGRHDIAEILLKVELNTKNQSKSINHNILCTLYCIHVSGT